MSKDARPAETKQEHATEHQQEKHHTVTTHEEVPKAKHEDLPKDECNS
jgi:hypothetical protein